MMVSPMTPAPLRVLPMTCYPVVPMMTEAFVIYYCDEIDSKLGAIDRIRQRHPEGGWSDWVNLLNRYLYFEDEKE